MVYTSQTAALAVLEMLVHLGRASILRAHVLIPCTFDEPVVSRLDRKRLPKKWRSYPAPPELQLIGDEWVRSGRSAVLEVPSAVIETESNYLLNPCHGDSRAIRVMGQQPFELDPRLLKSRSSVHNQKPSLAPIWTTRLGWTADVSRDVTPVTANSSTSSAMFSRL